MNRRSLLPACRRVMFLFALPAGLGAETVTVTAEWAQLRAEPWRTGEVVATVRRGDELRVLDRMGEWTRVAHPTSGYGYWLHAQATAAVASGLGELASDRDPPSVVRRDIPLKEPARPGGTKKLLREETLRPVLPESAVVPSRPRVERTATGRPPLRLTGERGSWQIEQNLPVPAVLLLAGITAKDTIYAVKRVEPGTLVDLGWRAVSDARILAWAGADERTRVRGARACEGGYVLDTATLDDVRRRIEATEVSTSEDARAAANAAGLIGEIQTGAWLARRNFDRNSRDRQEALENLRRDNPWEYQSIKRQDAQAEILETGAAAAIASRAGMDEQKSQWKQEARLLRPFVDRLGEIERVLQRTLENREALAAKSREFGALVARSLNEDSADAPEGVSRVCVTPASDLVDNITVRPRMGTRATRPLTLEVSFDDGSRAPVVAFPVLPESASWLAPIVWPPGASAAEVFVHLATRRTKLGRLEASRESLDQQARSVRQARMNAERRLKEALQLSETGGAENSGVVIY